MKISVLGELYFIQKKKWRRPCGKKQKNSEFRKRFVSALFLPILVTYFGKTE